ncbi:MAG: class A beta-lactamase-related serine hydrolase [Flavobacteriales bacterium TMED96]|nr:MAG: class A beta-lactamase-related serine hydrolase [Flavobacteriales bacterium TMED96]RPG55602.1 MAG: class A beta-lactamase-related serine hydrolase [Flavobacteriales bacterium TMED96]|tara:strand:- start:640 stop:1866 length:1227 start_codon:yes stop_codon:yes gene_type:complete
MKYYFLLIILSIISCADDIDMQKEFDKTDVPAAVMGKVLKNGTMKFYSFGNEKWDDDTKKADENTVFDIASMTKAITSVAILQLVESGKISLDDSVSKYIPEIRDLKIITETNFKEPVKAITIRNLLSHTSGIGYWFTNQLIANDIQNDTRIDYWPKKDQIKEDEYDWKFSVQPRRVFEAGERWLYGRNLGIAGRIIEKISGQNLESYFIENIFNPLEMNSTRFNLTDQMSKRKASVGIRDSITGKIKENYKRRTPKFTSDFYGGGGLKSSAKDYAKFLLCLLNNGTLNNYQILKESSVKLMMEKQLKKYTIKWDSVSSAAISNNNDKITFLDNTDNFSLGWAIETNPNEKIRPQNTGYWAGIFNSYYTFDPENELAIIYFSQFLPFNDETSFSLYKKFEEKIYSEIK